MLSKDAEASIKGAVDRLDRIGGRASRMMDALVRDGRLFRDNWSRVVRHDTSTAAETPVDVVKEVGVPASKLTVHSVGGGALEVNINSQGWVPVAAAMVFDNEAIRHVAIRSTTPAAGTAVLRLAAYVGPQ